jgi:hypothetical protein
MNWRKILFFVGTLLFLCIFILGSLVISNVTFNNDPAKASSSLRNIKSRLLKGEAFEMQKHFPEGAFFSYVLYGSSWVNIGLTATEPSIKQEAEHEALWALDRLEENEIAHQFSQPMKIEHGVFYAGWTNRLRGGILLLQAEHRNAQLEAEFHIETEKIALGFTDSSLPILESYPGQAWPADTIVALSSLAIHDTIYLSNYRELVIQPWLQKVETRYNTTHQLFPHQVNTTNGDVIKDIRGDSSAYALSLLPEVHAPFAQTQYEIYDREFTQSFTVFSLTREHPKGNSSYHTTNSGPIFFGYGATASVMNIAAANANLNPAEAEDTARFFSFIGLPLRNSKGTQYLFGKFLIYDIFLTWATTHHNWID